MLVKLVTKELSVVSLNFDALFKQSENTLAGYGRNCKLMNYALTRLHGCNRDRKRTSLDNNTSLTA